MTFLLPINASRLLLHVYSLSHQKIDCKPLGLSIPDPLELGGKYSSLCSQTGEIQVDKKIFT